MRKTIAVAGATGFIGKWFIKNYKSHFKIIGLSRNKIENPRTSEIEWRQVDLYSISSTTNALKNAGAGFVYQAYESSELSLADSVLSLI